MAMMEGKPLPRIPTPDSPVKTERGRLRKPAASGNHSRSASGQFQPSPEPSLQELRQGFAQDATYGAPSPLLPPPIIGGEPSSRPSSTERSRPDTPDSYYYDSRPVTPTLHLPGQSPSSSGSPARVKKEKTRSWLGKSKKDKDEERRPLAWIAGHPHKQPYDLDGLVNARPMPELWDDGDGNCYVYIFPRNSGKGASFKIDSAVFASSPVLAKLAFGEPQKLHDSDGRRQMPLDARVQDLSLHNPSTPPHTPEQRVTTLNSLSSTSSQGSRDRLSDFSDRPAEAHLYLPIKFQSTGDIPSVTQTPPRSQDGKDPAMEDIQTLVDIRNFFAFLCGQSLVATEKKHSFFHIFMTLAGILKAYDFGNADGSTYGNIASASFDNYVQELGLADVRTSREKSIEGIALGERMRSKLLYSEAFSHSAGKYDDLVNFKSAKFTLISGTTANRLELAAMDLERRIAAIRLILTDFEFPALFTGIMASKTSEERKEGVRFEAWKEAFLGFRKNYISLCKHRYGDWPPKAKSKKNDLETSGLNRMVLRDVYADMCALYDLLVDQTNLTTRTADGVDHAKVKEEPTIRALRAVLSEYDRSSPPVKPPVPFDLPQIPSLKATRPDFGTDKRNDIKAIQKKLKDDEIAHLLRVCSNEREAGPGASHTPFVAAFREMEGRAAHGCTITELVDLRIGQWIFMYVVLQALPLVVMDAPDVRWTKGVEYFLCEGPKGGLPWLANPNAVGASVGRRVSVPVEDSGVEGIYRRSHCWVMADKWRKPLPEVHEPGAVDGSRAPDISVPTFTQFSSELPPPPGAHLLAPGSRSSSPSGVPLSSFGGLQTPPPASGVTLEDSPMPAVGQGSPYARHNRPSAEYARPVTRSPQPPRPKSAVVHTVDSAKTFDAILADLGQANGRKKGKK